MGSGPCKKGTSRLPSKRVILVAFQHGLHSGFVVDDVFFKLNVDDAFLLNCILTHRRHSLGSYRCRCPIKWAGPQGAGQAKW